MSRGIGSGASRLELRTPGVLGVLSVVQSENDRAVVEFTPARSQLQSLHVVVSRVQLVALLTRLGVATGYHEKIASASRWKRETTIQPDESIRAKLGGR